jgi:hypothetical protein
LDGISKDLDSPFDVCRSFEGDVKGEAFGDVEAKEVPVGQVVAKVGWFFGCLRIVGKG